MPPETAARDERRSYDAVVFDLGGVVFPSPLDAFRAFERDHNLPHRFLSEVVLGGGDTGAWSRLERGEVTLDEFAGEFADECDRRGEEVDARALMTAVAEGLAPRPAMVDAIRSIRGHGLSIAALTNNWAVADPFPSVTAHNLPGAVTAEARRPFSDEMTHLGEFFDVVVESAVEGLRKPDPRIYTLVCDRLDVVPDRVVFLDDLGTNLKPARALGMTTIKVTDVDEALNALGSALGLALIPIDPTRARS